MAVFVLMNLLLVGTLGSTIGQRLLGIRVVRIGGACGSVSRGGSAVLIAVVIPAVVWDHGTRGFHDKIAGTVTVRI